MTWYIAIVSYNALDTDNLNHNDPDCNDVGTNDLSSCGNSIEDIDPANLDGERLGAVEVHTNDQDPCDSNPDSPSLDPLNPDRDTNMEYEGFDVSALIQDGSTEQGT